MTDKPGSPRGRRNRLMGAWFSPEEAALVEKAAEASDVSYSNVIRRGAVREAVVRLAGAEEEGGGE